MVNLKIFLLALFLTLTLTKTIPYIKEGINTTFDDYNNDFQFEYNGPGLDLILIYLEAINEEFNFEMNCSNISLRIEYTGIREKLIGMPLDLPLHLCKFKFTKNEENKKSKGSLVVYSCKKGLSIKLRNKYGNIRFPAVFRNSIMKITQLNFSVPKLERDVNAIFEYNKTYENEHYDIRRRGLENPFEVCHNQNCTENVSSYSFKKGESYEITIKSYKFNKEDLSIIPGFSFYDQKYNGTYSTGDIIDSEDNE